MRICKNCNSYFETEGAFCTKCGSKTIDCTPVQPVSDTVVEPAPAVEPAPVTEPVPTIESAPVVEAVPIVETAPAVESVPLNVMPDAPVYPNTNTPSASAKVMSYVGMGMGIFGFALGIIFFLCSFASFEDEYFGILITTYSIFSMGGSIAGMCLTSKASYYGVSSGACATGKVLSIIGLVINILAISIAFCGAVCSF